MPQLDHAIEQLYEAFDDVPAPQHMTGCPCCTRDDEFQQLLRTPRRDLTIDEISRYALKAISTQGTEADYLYFFPRIVELLFVGETWINWEIVFGKIGETSPATWPDRRREGLEAFLVTLLDVQARERANDFLYGSVIEELVCCVGRSGMRLGPYLRALLAYPDALLAFYEHSLNTLHADKLGNAFWGNSTRINIEKLGPSLRELHLERQERYMAAQAEVVAWLKSDAVEAVVYGLVTPD